MKAFLALLSIALVAQVSFASSVQRSRRDTKDSFQAMKDLVADQVTMIAAVLKEMPNTEDYSSFKQYWVDYTEAYNTKHDDLMCVVKLEGLLDGFAEGVANYKAPDAPAEAKEMLRLFNKHGLEKLIEGVKARFGKFDFKDLSGILETC